MSTLADLLIEIGVDTKEVAGAGKDIEGKFKKTWAGVGKAAAIGGAAIGGAVLAGIDQVMETSKPLAVLNAQLGASGEFAGEVGKAAGDLYAKGVVDSMEDATGAIRAVWQNKLVPEDAGDDAIAAVGGKLSNLATIAEDETGNVANAVKQMIRNGLVKNADEGFDLLTRSVQTGVNKAGDIFDTYNEYGTQFRKLGLSGADSMGLMSQAIKAGARDADTAADAIKEFSLRATDGTAAAAGGYKMLGLSAKDYERRLAKGGPAAKKAFGEILNGINKIEDPQKRTNAQLAFFGTKAEDLGQAVGAFNLDSAADSLGKVAGAADKAGNTLEQSAGAKLEGFKRQAQAALVDQLAKAIPYIEATFGWLSKNSSWVTPLATGLGILAVAIGIVTAVQWAWNAAQLASPTTWIIIGIIALIAIIVLVATKTKFFQTVWEAVWGFMKAVGAWFAGPFAGFFVSLWNKIVAFAKGTWNAISMYFGFWYGLFMKVYGWAKDVISKIKGKFDSFVGWVKGLPGRISSSLSSMWNGLKNGFRAAVNWVVDHWNALHFTIPSFDVLGMHFGGGTIGVPNIPRLADGALIRHSAGGSIVNVAEGGEDEAVVPLSRLPDVAQGQRSGTTKVVIEGAETEFRRWLKKSIRVKGPIEGIA